MEPWVVGALANGAIFAGYMAIAWWIFSGLGTLRDSLANPLALATGFIFLTCGIGHGFHLWHMFDGLFGADSVEQAARATHDWHLSLWDALTAAVAIWYVTLRPRFASFLHGAALFEDVRARRRQALDIHDNIVQGLTSAKLAIELGHADEGLDLLDHTLAASRSIITELLGDEDSEVAFGPGELRRKTPGAVR